MGKTTLAKEVVGVRENAIYPDLELDSDRMKVENDPELFFEINKGKLICLDEIQFLPNLFRTLRAIIDQYNKNGQFLILGSASRELIKQSSESLAGRISYIEMNPFSRQKVKNSIDFWLQGGYPRSILANNLETSYDWRQDYIQSFLERDLPTLGFRVPSTVSYG